MYNKSLSKGKFLHILTSYIFILTVQIIIYHYYIYPLSKYYLSTITILIFKDTKSHSERLFFVT